MQRKLLLKMRTTALALCVFGIPVIADAGEPPQSWVDPGTGHRVVRLTKEPNSASLYFNQNGYTADGKRLDCTEEFGAVGKDQAQTCGDLFHAALWQIHIRQANAPTHVQHCTAARNVILPMSPSRGGEAGKQ